MDKTTRSALIAVLFAALLVSSAMLYDNYRLETVGDIIYSEAIDEFLTTQPPESTLAADVTERQTAAGATTATESVPETTAAQTTRATQTRPIITRAEDVQVDFERLMQVNAEVVGWIIVENTTISYPVMQGADNDKYLTTTYNNKYSKYGSIFVDYRLSADFSGRHTLVFGHNMRNNAMFGTLLQFTGQSYWQTRRYFHILTPGGMLKYEIFAAYTADVGSDTYLVSFRDREHYAEVLGKMLAWSEIDTGVTPTADDKIVTLCTCTSDASERDTKRYVVHGRLIYDGRAAESGR